MFPLPENLDYDGKENPFHYELPKNIYSVVLSLFFFLSSIRFTSALSMQKFSKLTQMFKLLRKKRTEISRKVFVIQRTDTDITFKKTVTDGYLMDFSNFTYALYLLSEKWLYGIGGRKKWIEDHNGRNGVTRDHDLKGLGAEERFAVIMEIYKKGVRPLTRIEMLELVLFGFEEWKYKITTF